MNFKLKVKTMKTNQILINFVFLVGQEKIDYLNSSETLSLNVQMKALEILICFHSKSFFFQQVQEICGVRAELRTM